MDQLIELQKLIDESQNIVFFGGAGVSTESNIPDFRSAKGLYSMELQQAFSPEEMVSHSMFVQHPELFFDFYKKHLIYPQAKPNAAHHYLARLEKSGKLKAIVTQNIDCLHEMAGSQQVLKVHGSVDRNYCTNCQTFYDLAALLALPGEIPTCESCGGIVKPDVTLYGETLDDAVFSQAIQAIAQADLLIIGGTSLVVYPAAGLVQYFRGKHLVVVNHSKLDQDRMADLVIQGKIGEVFAQLRPKEK